MLAVAAGPRLPAPSTARTDSLTVLPGGSFSVAQVHLDPRTRGAGQRDQLAWQRVAVERREEPERAGRACVARA